MLIYYLFIPKFRSLENLNINLGGEYRFHYEPGKKKLTAEKNSNYISDFFCSPNGREQNAKIRNVSAIIGENGAGKSTLLSFIKENFVEGMGGTNDSMIVAMQNDTGELKIYYDEAIEFEFDKAFGFEPIELLGKIEKHIVPGAGLVDYVTRPQLRELMKSTFVYYSNVYDGYLEYQFEGLNNISTNFLLLREDSKVIESEDGAYTRANHPENHRRQEVFRQLDLINSLISPKLPFKTPTSLAVILAEDYLNKYNPFEDMHVSSMLDSYGYTQFMESLLSAAEIAINSTQERHEQLIIRLSATAVLNYFREFAMRTPFYTSHLIRESKIQSEVPLLPQLDTLLNDLIADVKKSFQNLKLEGRPGEETRVQPDPGQDPLEIDKAAAFTRISRSTLFLLIEQASLNEKKGFGPNLHR